MFSNDLTHAKKMFSPNRAWHNCPNRIEDMPQPLWRNLPFAVRLQLIGMPTDPLLLHATKLPTDADFFQSPAPQGEHLQPVTLGTE